MSKPPGRADPWGALASKDLHDRDAPDIVPFYINCRCYHYRHCRLPGSGLPQLE